MSDVQSYETPIMSMDEFGIGLLEKDRIPGLLIRSDENGYYNIGIQINDTEVVVVDSTLEGDSMGKALYWGDQVNRIQEMYKDRKPTLKPYKKE